MFAPGGSAHAITFGNEGFCGFAPGSFQVEPDDREAKQAVVQREIDDADGKQQPGAGGLTEVQDVVEQAGGEPEAEAARRAHS